jgi:hypothetical protein
MDVQIQFSFLKFLN